MKFLTQVRALCQLAGDNLGFRAVFMGVLGGQRWVLSVLCSSRMDGFVSYGNVDEGILERRRFSKDLFPF